MSIESSDQKKKRSKISNCLLFVIEKWRKYDGYVAIRKSKYGWWPHFIWIKKLNNAEIEHFVPIERKLHKKYIDKILFKGEVKTNDD